MKIITETNDGFELSQKDLEMRGQGDLFGSKQSGVPEFKIADIVEDFLILETAREAAARLLNQKEFFTSAEFTLLREEVGIEKGQVLILD